MSKYYKYGQEIDPPLVHNIPIDKRVIRWCQSPVFVDFPGCMEIYYTCEMEEVQDTVKHLQGVHTFMRCVPGTTVYCYEMPLGYCQRLYDADELRCNGCGQKIDYDGWVKAKKSWSDYLNREVK